MLRNHHWSRRVLVGAAGVALALGVTPAMSAVARDVGLPAPGADYELKLSSSDVKLTAQGQECSASLAGSLEAEAKVESPQNSGDDVMSMDFDDMQLTGSSSSCGGSDQQGLGRIRIKQDSTTITPPNTLEMTQVVPPTFEQSVFMDFTMTVENPPQSMRQGSAQQSEPLTLTPKNPAELVGQLKSIPPEGAAFRLQNPIELSAPGDDTTVATLDKLPLEVSAL